MGIATAIAAIGVAASVAGSAVSYRAQRQQASEQRRAVAAQSQAQERVEAQRQLQMNLDATRRKREVIRQQQIARAAAVSTAGAQGASEGSGLGGAIGGISGMSGVNMLGISQNQEIGNEIYSANAASRAAGNAYNLAGASSSAFTGGAISSFGGALVKNSETIGRVGSYFGGNRGTGGLY